MKKTVKAVEPYMHEGHLNFKQAPYEAWIKCQGQVGKPIYPPNRIKGFFYNYSFPKIYERNNEARLRFVEAYSVSFDSFPDYISYEIIPYVWDCWPTEFDKFCRWIEKYKIRTIFFSCKETAEKTKKQYPNINAIYCPEGIDSVLYDRGRNLRNREIDLFEFGRGCNGLLDLSFPDKYIHVCSRKRNGEFMTDEEFHSALVNSKVTICYPHSITDPIKTDGLETLTQRYWECMLSRMVIVGHAPKELVDFIGYNPVIELDLDNPLEHIISIIKNIDNFQELVDKNRNIAEKKADWKFRIQFIMSELRKLNYNI